MVKDVYNTRQKICVKYLARQTPMQALLEQFSLDDYVSRDQCDELGHITHLFFAGDKSIALAKLNPEVLLLDCTYKTNDLGLLLLVVVGITGKYTSFYTAFFFFKSEKEEDFVWAL
jgi:hypothetical protein